MSNFDVKVINTKDYALVITVDKNSVADVHGQVPPATVVTVLRQLADHFEQKTR